MTKNQIELTGFFREAMDRGFVYQFSKNFLEMNDLFMGEPITGYVGFDCTANSLHVGNLASLMLLRLFRRHGHIPIVLLGTATSRIGDPSGKDEARTMLTQDDINDNSVGIANAVRRILEGCAIRENHEWLCDDYMGIVPFLAEVGQHFSVNRMLTQDSVKNRLDRGSPLSYLEFSYMVIQAYDFVQLNQRDNCVIQMGGSDQWGNIVMGIELGRRMHSADLFGLTTPLIETAAGTKMGKTGEGAIWLNSDRLTPYEYWQFWRNTADADVKRFLRLFTELPLDEIVRLDALSMGAEINDAKKILATHATAICHGEQAAKIAAGVADDVFTRGGSEGLPTTEMVIAANEKVRLADVFVKAGLAESISAARRLAREGGAYVHAATIDEARMMEPADFNHHSEIKIRAGKKRHAIVKFRFGRA